MDTFERQSDLTRGTAAPSAQDRWQLADAKPMFRSPPAAPPAHPQPPSPPAAPAARRVLRDDAGGRGQSIADVVQAEVRAQAPALQGDGDQDRRGSSQPTERMIGRLASCSGSKAVIATSATHLSGASTDFWSVGKLISIEASVARIVAMVVAMNTPSGRWTEGESNDIAVEVELIGEISDHELRGTTFRRGISHYPQLGAVAHRIRAGDLEAMHDTGANRSIEVGTLSQNDQIPARISVDDLLRRHFAVLGTTGVGKSSAVTLLVRQAAAAVPTLRVLMLDPHNEFLAGLSDIAVGIDVADLNLPYWLFRYEELEDIIFRGHPVAEESDVLREFVAQAKTIRRGGGRAGTISADTPWPYRMSDILLMIDEMMGHLEPRFDRALLRPLKVRIDSLMQDPRYAFLFTNGGLDDNFAAVISTIFRIPGHGKPVSILNLSSVPSDVLNAVVSVLARLAFDVAYASRGALNVLLVCEEAHRYVPADAGHGFVPTRRAIARIAKEGRKYGCAIAIVTQRPGELDPTILSQCSTVFAMRLTNDRDQDIIRAAISDSSSSTISFLSALDNREAIAFGEAVAAPMRLYFTYQERARLPFVGNQSASIAQSADEIAVDSLVATLRHTTLPARRSADIAGAVDPASQSAQPAPAAVAAPAVARPVQTQATAAPRAPAAQAAGNPSPLRTSLLRKPLDSL
jgi:uncharacterized protein